MAIKLESVVAGAVFYSRSRHKMGNTTISTLGEYRVRVVEPYDSEKGYAICEWNSNRGKRYYAHELRPLYDWSMYDKDEAEITYGMCHSVVKVKRRKKCPKCKQRHASEECPPKVMP